MDFASRLVRTIKQVLGMPNAESATEGQRMQPADDKASPTLRAVFVLGGAIMLALWGVSLIPAIEGWNNPNEDGFSFVPAFWATITLLPLGLITLAGGILGRGKSAARARISAVIGAALLVLLLLLEGLRRFSEMTAG